ncbi:uncharacterized protein stg1 [Eurosta solidaginis]|uniref:uncharacterized protein stg1 n=1 Tax=Eurosta solidaginis TaxID=178769 RepID=UPI0035315EB0
MRQHSTVPNVFRVSHNSNSAKQPHIQGNGVEQQQKQQTSHNQKLHQSQQQTLINTSNLTNAIKTTTIATTTKANNIITDNKVDDLKDTPQHTDFQSHNNGSNSNSLQKNNNNSNASIRQYCNITKATMLQNHTQQPHKLTATASIERASFGGSLTQAGRREQFQQQQQLKSQQSLYGTLPRVQPPSTITAFPQRNTSGNSNNNARNMNGIGASGVIRTISGNMTSIAAKDHNVNKNNSSLSSDMNGDLSSSTYSNSNKLNGIQPHQMHNSTREFLVTRPGGRISQYQQQRKRQYGYTTAQRYSNGGYLWILTPVAASISVAIVIAAIAGPQWLFTEEKLPNANYNGTANFNMMDDGAYITKYTKSSLWILCTALQGVEKYNCIKIDYFPKEGYQPDPNDSTAAIPFTVTKSCPFFLASGILLLISFIVFLVPTCSHQNNLYYFSAGIMFIVSGLLMLIGLIAYISILKAEIGSKLRSRSSLQPALFKVTYGQSFFLFVIGFITTEFVGLLNIFLFISLQEIGYHNRLPCFNITNLQEKLKEGETSHSHTYKSYKHSISSATVAPIVRKPQQRPRLNSCNNHNKVHNDCRAPPAAELELDSAKLLHQIAGYVPCRRHPNAAETFVNNDLERRYYFAKTHQPKCNLHSKNFAKSLNELNSNSTHGLPPPPPSAIKMGSGSSQTLPSMPKQYVRYGDLTTDFAPLTRSISTTTDIFPRHATPHNERKTTRRNMATNTRPFDPAIQSESERGGDESENERSQQQRRRQELVDSQSVSFYDDDDDGPPQRLCGLKRGIRKTKDELFQEFCKRAGMRPKPKNIYFIASEEDALAASDNEIQRRHHANRFGIGQRNENCCREFGRVNGEDRDEEGEMDVTDDDGGEGGFSQLQDDEECIYVIQDNSPYGDNPPLRRVRRSSVSAEPTHLRKLKSNLSLAATYPPENQSQNTSYDMERSDSAIEIWPPPPNCSNDEAHYAAAKSAYCGSQNRLHQDYQANAPIYQSRTLPRSFLKSNTNSQNSLGSGALHASASALHNTYSSSQNRLANCMLHQQQQQQQHQQQLQLQQQTLYLSQSHAADIYNSALKLHKSNDELSSGQANAYYGVRRQQSPQSTTVHNLNNDSRLQQPAIHWPAAIPSSPSGYTSNYQQMQQLAAPSATRPHTKAPNLAHSLLQRSFSSNTSGGADSGIGSGGGGSSVMSVPPKFQRAFAFDEQRRPSALLGEAFDTEGLELERRRSHASVYSGISLLGVAGGGGSAAGCGIIGNGNADHFDLINGTAV